MIDPFEEIEQREELEKARKERSKELELAFKKTLSTREGRLVLAWVLDVSGLDCSITTYDQMALAALSGRRDVGVILKNQLEKMDFENYLLLVKERNIARSSSN